MSNLNHLDRTQLDVSLLDRPRRHADSRRVSDPPIRPALLDTLNDALNHFGGIKGHEDLVEHYVVQDFVPGTKKETRDESCLVAIALDQFSHGLPSGHPEDGQHFHPTNSSGESRHEVRGITIFTLRG